MRGHIGYTMSGDSIASKRGFTLIEVLIALVIASVLGLAIIDSYRVTNRISKFSSNSANILQDSAGLQAYLNYLLTNAGASLVPQQGIRTFNDKDCDNYPAGNQFFERICSNGSLPALHSPTDVLLVAYGLPFQFSSPSDYARIAAQVDSVASANVFYLRPNSPLDSVYTNHMESYYIGRPFLLYSKANPGESYLGYISSIAQEGGKIKIGAVNISDFILGNHTTVQALFAAASNIKMVMVDLEVIYLDAAGNIMDVLLGPYDTMIVRPLASNAEAINIKYYNSSNGNWEDTVDPNNIRNYTRARIGMAFTNYYNYPKKCEGTDEDGQPYQKQINLLGDTFYAHFAGKWSIKDPCSIHSTFFLQVPFKNILFYFSAEG